MQDPGLLKEAEALASASAAAPRALGMWAKAGPVAEELKLRYHNGYTGYIGLRVTIMGIHSIRLSCSIPLQGRIKWKTKWKMEWELRENTDVWKLN